MERSSSTFPQICTFFVPNTYGLTQMVLKWEAKVIVVDVEVAKTNYILIKIYTKWL